jgi:hypothetical protein
MTRTKLSLEGAAIGLVIANVVTVGVVVSGLLLAQRTSDHSDDGLVALTDDVTRASQAQAAAERMVAVGRGYLLTTEPELLARAQAAEAKLLRTVRTIVASTRTEEERRGLDPLLASAKHYREVFSALLSGENAPYQPREVADAMRKRLIPARDDLTAALDALVARRLGQLEVLRSSARDLRATTVHAMMSLGVVGVLGTVLLVWVVVARARGMAPIRSGATIAYAQPPNGARDRRFSRRALAARPRP